MGKPAILAIKVLSDTRKAKKGLQETEHATGRLMGALGKLGGIALAGAAAAGGALAALAITGIKQAADLEQSIGAVDTVFKGAADQMHRYAAGAAETMGLTQNQYNELATVLGTQLKNGGTTIDQLADKTNGLIGLGADLASMFGGTTPEAVAALSSALKGERDPIERYGVSLKQAQIDAKAAELGFVKVGGSLSNEANQAATLALIMEQTADAHGNFAKETDTLAGQQAILAAQWGNFTTSIGQAFLPILTKVMGIITGSLMPGLKNLGEYIKTGLASFLDAGGDKIGKFGDTLKGLADHAVPLAQSLASGLSDVGKFLGKVFATLEPIITATITGIMPYLSGIHQKFSEMTSAFLGAANAILDFLAPIINTVLVPIFQTAAQIIGGAITVLFDTLSGAFNFIKAVFTGDWQTLWNGVKDFAVNVWNNLQARVVGIFTGIRDFFAGFGNAVASLFGTSWSRVKEIVFNAIGGVVDTVRGLPGRALSALGNAGSYLWQAGSDLIQGFINGIKNMGGMLWDAVVGIVKNAINGLKAFLGIASPSKKMIQYGMFTGQGYVNGLKLMKNDAAEAMQDLVSIPDTPDLTANVNGLAGAHHTAVYNITINGILDGDDAARKIQELLQRQSYRMGTVTV